MNKNKTHKKKYKKIIINRLSIIIFVLIILILLIFGFVKLTNKIFSVKNIISESNTKYTSQDIINNSGINIGDNLLFLDTKKARNNIYKNLSYIENIQIKKKFPDKIIINTSISEIKYNLISQDNNKYYLISKNSKILETREENIPELVTLTGIKFFVSDLGDIVYEDSNIKNIIKKICDLCENKNLNLIKSIDFSDKFNIIINYDDRINILFGDSQDIEYKILTISEIILNRINNSEKGTLDVRELKNTSKSYFNVNN